MEDLTLTSDLFNNIKFNMQKLILDVPSHDVKRLAAVFGDSQEHVSKLIDDLDDMVTQQAEKLRREEEIPEPAGRRTVAFVGDSITSDRASYLNILKKIYEDDDRITFVDAAVSGDKSDDAVMKFYMRTLNHHPDVVHILIGTNDLRHNDDTFGESAVSLEDYRRNMCYMLQTLKEQNIPVVISQISPVFVEGVKKRFPEDHWTYDDQEIGRLNQIVREVAQTYGAKVNAMEEVYRQYEPRELLFQDGLHLNEKGQYLLAVNVLRSLKEFL